MSDTATATTQRKRIVAAIEKEYDHLLATVKGFSKQRKEKFLKPETRKKIIKKVTDQFVDYYGLYFKDFMTKNEQVFETLATDYSCDYNHLQDYWVELEFEDGPAWSTFFNEPLSLKEDSDELNNIFFAMGQDEGFYGSSKRHGQLWEYNYRECYQNFLDFIFNKHGSYNDDPAYEYENCALCYSRAGDQQEASNFLNGCWDCIKTMDLDNTVIAEIKSAGFDKDICELCKVAHCTVWFIPCCTDHNQECTEREDTDTQCLYIFTQKGPKQGHRCDDSRGGDLYCKKHSRSTTITTFTTAIMHYQATVQEKLRTDNPKLTDKEFEKLLQKGWAELSVKDKKPFLALEAQDKDRYEKQKFAALLAKKDRKGHTVLAA